MDPSAQPWLAQNTGFGLHETSGAGEIRGRSARDGLGGRIDGVAQHPSLAIAINLAAPRYERIAEKSLRKAIGLGARRGGMVTFAVLSQP
jgi:hypothetical protein